ncbi:conserved Plasmodium protein, unknown function [Plasmodium gallinaceum]|uniref:Uncharacterized protein n=1 Tax=Plasmodium gallinaceum TaxID=5849 RepID=A0A1J1GYV4_PLAGA|nr:conserved Plasmodium protein, unknown function [Plasmodium gallinaceum]CRG97417.1 conserved Plasmodium protein, unknown function [Plasmodium gallinaceum]
MNYYLYKNYSPSKYIKSYNLFKKNKNVKYFSYAPIPKRVGFTKPTFKLNRKAQKYIVNVQWLKSSDKKKLEKLCKNIIKDANSFNSYEIIDLIYYLSKHSYKNIYLTIEPLLFHFFLKYNTSVNLNGISLHRLLRVLTEYQDLVYREWIYSIAKIISKKHAHISMRDIQLILDDLALFYDFQIQCQIIPFYKTIINRINELEIKRLPFLIHVIGRIGCNNNDLLNILFNTLRKNICKNELYRSDFSGLMLRGLANLKILPDKNILYQLYKPVRDNINYTNIKYISWCADGFSRLNYFFPLPLLVNQILKMKDKISHLELNDFSSILNCIQAYILIKLYNNHSVNSNMSKGKSFTLSSKNNKNSLSNNQDQFNSDILNIETSKNFKCFENDDNLNTLQNTNSSMNKNLYIENQTHIEENLKKEEKLFMNENNYLNEEKKYIIENKEKSFFSNLNHQTNHKEKKKKNDIIIDKNEFNVKKEGKYNNKDGCKDSYLENKESINIFDEDTKSSSNKKYLNGIYSNFDINDNLISVEKLYDIYLKLENLIIEKISESIYNSTPPYRVIMFELMTRLFRFYGKPIDLILNMKTHRYDTSLLLKYTNSLQLIISDQNSRQKSNSELSFYVRQFDISNEFFFGDVGSLEEPQDLLDKEEIKKLECENMHELAKNIKQKKNKADIIEKTSIDNNQQKINGNNTKCQNEENHLNVNIPLPKIFKNFLHSIFFRTPALGGRTIMLLLIALVRLNFGEREKLEYLNPINSHILPFMKANEIYRPLTKCIIREMIRKLETFNAEELIICAICLNELDALNLNNDFFSLLIDRLLNLKKDNYISKDQLLQLKKLFNFWFNKKKNLMKTLNFTSIKQIKKYFFT